MTEWKEEIMEGALKCPLTRRQFLKGLLAAGAMVAVPGGLMKGVASTSEVVF